MSIKDEINATDGDFLRGQKIMGDYEWFKNNCSVDREADRREEEKAMKRRERERARESSSEKKKNGWFGR